MRENEVAMPCDIAPVIQVEDLGKSFAMGLAQVEVLRHLSFCVGVGEFVAVMGRSGSGKSTLMHILGCLDRPDSGQYFFAGDDVTFIHDDERAVLRAENIGFVFQRFHLLPRHTVYENVTMPFMYRKIAAETVREQSIEAIERVGLAERINHTPAELSGGEMQRVAIARAIAGRPQIILADEPTGNLDQTTGDTVMELIAELNDQGTTVLLVTHDEQVARRAQRTMVLKNGRFQ